MARYYYDQRNHRITLQKYRWQPAPKSKKRNGRRRKVGEAKAPTAIPGERPAIAYGRKNVEAGIEFKLLKALTESPRVVD